MRPGVRLKGVKVITKANGKRYVYRRVGGSLIPLPNLPENDPRFLEAYIKAGTEQPRRIRSKPGSIAALCETYLTSTDFADLAKSTRAARSRVVRKISEERGKGMLGDLRPDHIRKDVRALTHGAASMRLKAWRGLFAYAVEEGMIAADPSAGIKIPKGKTRPFKQWSQGEIDAYRAYWNPHTPERVAFEVIYWTACACVDAVKIGHQHVDEDGWLSMPRQKTGELFTVPIRTLPSWAKAMKADHAHFLGALPNGLQWITTNSGKPRGVKPLSQFIAAAARDAGLPKDCTAHGLRKARAAAIAAAGGTPSQIGAWLGDVSLAMAAHYTRQADRKQILGAEQERNTGNRKATVSKIRE